MSLQEISWGRGVIRELTVNKTTGLSFLTTILKGSAGDRERAIEKGFQVVDVEWNGNGME